MISEKERLLSNAYLFFLFRPICQKNAGTVCVCAGVILHVCVGGAIFRLQYMVFYNENVTTKLIVCCLG